MTRGRYRAGSMGQVRACPQSSGGDVLLYFKLQSRGRTAQSTRTVRTQLEPFARVGAVRLKLGPFALNLKGPTSKPIAGGERGGGGGGG